jgi:predicted nucleotide-binding protein (sugar kinase/HSP70/actin superfamily)
MRAALFMAGDAHVATDAFLKGIGLEPLQTRPTSKSTVSRGVANSPEFACFPFKVMLGSLMQALDDGAELCIIPGNNSQVSCQLSDFSRVQEHIMKRAGRRFEMMSLDTLHPQRLLEKFQRYNPGLTMQQLIQSALVGRQKLILLELIEDCYRNIFLSEGKERAEAFRGGWKARVDGTDSLVDLHFIDNSILQDFTGYRKVDPAKHLKIAVIGDIFCLNDRFVNNDIYDRLLAQGVYVKQGIRLSVMLTNPLNRMMKELSLDRTVERYLKHNVASYAKNTVKEAIESANDGYDGLIQIYPFNCMPEVTARNILPKVSKDYNIPVLFLAIDEQTGDAGFTTRIEAFIDLLRMRRQK